MSLKSCVIVLSGPPLTGKSWLAEGLAREISFVHLDINGIRQELFPNPELKLLGSHTERFVVMLSYAELTKRAFAWVEQGKTVVLTGTFSMREFKMPLEMLYNALVERGTFLRIPPRRPLRCGDRTANCQKAGRRRSVKHQYIGSVQVGFGFLRAHRFRGSYRDRHGASNQRVRGHGSAYGNGGNLISQGIDTRDLQCGLLKFPSIGLFLSKQFAQNPRFM
mgnify:FL=1